jgi:hypothetical protein
MPRQRALLAASAMTPAPPESADAASGSLSRSIEPSASSDACVTDAATTPQPSTPTDGAAHPSEVPEGQVVVNSGHQITHAGRLMLGDAAVDAALVAAESVAVRHADQSDPTAAPSVEPPDACTAMQHKERLMKMFLTAEEGPVASRHDAVTEQATLEYVIGMDKDVRAFWTAHADEVIRRCAPSMPKGLLDQQEVFGFALADGVGRPLLPHDAARAVGSAGDDALKSAKGGAERVVEQSYNSAPERQLMRAACNREDRAHTQQRSRLATTGRNTLKREFKKLNDPRIALGSENEPDAIKRLCSAARTNRLGAPEWRS